MGPAAEMLRNQVGPAGDPDELLLNLWAGEVDLDGIAEVSFDNCSGFGISPEDLVGDRYGPTQDLASRLRIEGWAGLSRSIGCSSRHRDTRPLRAARLAPVPPTDLES
jgi:hypothetical protein